MCRRERAVGRIPEVIALANLEHLFASPSPCRLSVVVDAVQPARVVERKVVDVSKPVCHHVHVAPVRPKRENRSEQLEVRARAFGRRERDPGEPVDVSDRDVHPALRACLHGIDPVVRVGDR